VPLVQVRKQEACGHDSIRYFVANSKSALLLVLVAFMQHALPLLVGSQPRLATN
jgi:hypothetical protein